MGVSVLEAPSCSMEGIKECSFKKGPSIAEESPGKRLERAMIFRNEPADAQGNSIYLI